MATTTLDTYEIKDNWTPEHYALYETIPQEIRDIAGDLFEIRWYGGGGLAWELEHNLLGTKAKADAFMEKYQALSNEQKNLIYYAYEA
jgi:hypothetical protein